MFREPGFKIPTAAATTITVTAATLVVHCKRLEAKLGAEDGRQVELSVVHSLSNCRCSVYYPDLTYVHGSDAKAPWATPTGRSLTGGVKISLGILEFCHRDLGFHSSALV